MRTDIPPKAIYLKDYTPPHWRAEHVDLSFRIFDDKTLVRAATKYRKNHKGEEPLILNGEHLKLLSVKINGKTPDHEVDDKFLTIHSLPGDEFTLEVETEIDPASNTRLEGLYKSGGNWCTQCEAEGFRTITYYADRPDNMATFRVRVEADKATCPVLLSNGNLIEEGTCPSPAQAAPSHPLPEGRGSRDIGARGEGNRHFAIWDDPTPKPCYLFALVAGNLQYIQDHFKTRSGLDVDLRIYVRDGDQKQCAHAMDSLKRCMKWDEDAYGREYQYTRFNIVAVSDFNMGAMENTSLNIFNTALVLAHPETATDTDFERVEGVIGHEYFHNWTGNRITCRDWFQLSLKEGFTVFRDQEFSADMNSRDVQRIDDVAALRRMQFPEDAGPLAHPVRPDNYIEINNFYTMTVYEKGAEVIRMQRTLLGPEKFRAATDLYFDRFDGMAVTCDDFVQCMQDASGIDLSQFKLWYSQAGTPEITAKGAYDEKARTYTLELSQHLAPTPGQPRKEPMHIPVRVGLVGPDGADMNLVLSSRRKPGSCAMLSPDPCLRRDDMSIVLELTEAKQTFVFENIASRPVPSILRGFSAPVKLKTDLSNDDLRFLMVHDSDGFNRWEAGQTLALRLLNEVIDATPSPAQASPPHPLPEGRGSRDIGARGEGNEFLTSYGLLLEQCLRAETDKALLARALALPDVSFIGQHRDTVDPCAIYAARESVLATIRDRFGDMLREIYAMHHDPAAGTDFAASSRRALKNIVLRVLNDETLAKTQYDAAQNMTDRVAALAVLGDGASPARAEAFADFYKRFATYPLVIDKWFSLQAAAIRPSALQDVAALRVHPAFNIKNPNRARSLYGAFAMNNPVCFHAADGGGYKLLADAVIELNGINPQIAARMLTPFKEWRRYTPDRQAKMKAELQRISAAQGLSPDVFEIVSKSLA